MISKFVIAFALKYYYYKQCSCKNIGDQPRVGDYACNAVFVVIIYHKYIR